MSEVEESCHPRGKHRYTSVVEGMALANDFARSGLSASAFARQRGVTFNMVRYWSARSRRLAVASHPRGELVQVAEVSETGAVIPSPIVPSPTLSSVPAPIALAKPSSLIEPPAIEVRLPNGVRIGIGSGFSPQVLSQVIACVSGRPC